MTRPPGGWQYPREDYTAPGVSLPVKDEGSTLTLVPTSFNFTGAGVTATVVGSDVTVDIPGGGGGSSGGGGALVPLFDTTLLAAQATVPIVGIPAGYRDLLIVVHGRGDDAATFVQMYCVVNSDTGANYDLFFTESHGNGIFGSNDEFAQVRWRIGYLAAAGSPANTPSSFETKIFGYAGSIFHKQMTTQSHLKTANTATNYYLVDRRGTYRSTSPINRLDLSLSAGNFAANTRVTVWGVAATAGATIGGGAAIGGGQLLQEQKLGTAAATFQFDNIPQTYRDLVLVIRARGTYAGANFARPRIRLNNDSTAGNYDWIRENAHDSGLERESDTSGGAATTAAFDVGVIPTPTGPASYRGVVVIRIFDYTSPSYYKSVQIDAYGQAVGENYRISGGGTYKSITTISALTALLDNGNYDVDSSASLYGVGGSAAGGVGLSPDTPPTTANAADDEWEGLALDTAGTRRTSATPWAWDQQGTATAQLVRGRLILTAPGDGSGTGKMRSLLQALPAGDGTYETEFRVFGLTGTFSAAGVVLRESGTDKRLWLTKGIDSGSKIQVRRLTSFTGWTANPYNNGGDEALGWETIYAKVQRSGANLIISLGDGAYYSARYTFAETSEFTVAANQIGLSAWAISAETVVLTSGWWRKTA